MSPARGRYTPPVLTATSRLAPTAAQAKPYTVLNPNPAAVSRHPAAPLVPSRDPPDGGSKISRGPALHQPGTNVAPTGALA
jgi:hypothetical protein